MGGRRIDNRWRCVPIPLSSRPPYDAYVSSLCTAPATVREARRRSRSRMRLRTQLVSQRTCNPSAHMHLGGRGRREQLARSSTQPRSVYAVAHVDCHGADVAERPLCCCSSARCVIIFFLFISGPSRCACMPPRSMSNVQAMRKRALPLGDGVRAGGHERSRHGRKLINDTTERRDGERSEMGQRDGGDGGTRHKREERTTRDHTWRAGSRRDREKWG